MTRFNGVHSAKASARALGGKGLLLALLLAGIGIQGCATDESPAAPADAEIPAADMPREDATGADLPDGVPGMETLAEGEAPALAKAAPSCVDLYYVESTFWRTASVSNGCNSGQRIRLIWAWALDGKCVYLPPGKIYNSESRRKPAYVSEIRGC